jgi:hypothetical protein
MQAKHREVEDDLDPEEQVERDDVRGIGAQFEGPGVLGQGGLDPLEVALENFSAFANEVGVDRPHRAAPGGAMASMRS